LVAKLPTMGDLASHYHERLTITKRVKRSEESGEEWRSRDME